MWLTLFVQCMASLFYFNAKDVSVMNEIMQAEHFDRDTRVFHHEEKSKNGHTNYNISHLYILHETACMRV